MHQPNTRSILRSLEYAPPVQDQPFVERHAGVLLSVALHAGLFSFMFMHMPAPNFQTKIPERPKPIIVQLTSQQPQVEPGGAAEIGEPMLEQTAQPMQTVAAQPETDSTERVELDVVRRQIIESMERATQTERAEVSEPVQLAMAVLPEIIENVELKLPPEPILTAPAKPQSAPSSPKSAEQVQPENPKNTLTMELTPEAREVLENLKSAREELSAANRTEGYRGSGDVAMKLNMIEAEQIAQKTLFSERGLRKGVVRKLVTDDVDPNIAQEVFEKYGIRTYLANTQQAAPQGGGYLSGAVTHQGNFVQQAGGKGLYHIFTYTDAAMAHMTRLEDFALREKGLDPEYARVISVKFGVVATAGGYDLGVLDLMAEPIPH